MAPDGLLAAYKEVLDEHGILLISDEVQTGWGRTGAHFWGISAHGITPDAMTFAKGLGNGFAIGGVVARGELLDGIRGNGISTFGGNPIATAAGNATLDYVLSHDLQRNAAVTGELIISGLQEAAEHARHRRRGARQGPDVRRGPGRPGHQKPSPPLAARMLEATKERGLLVGKGGLYGNTLRMAPPLTLSEAEAKEGLGILIDALTAVNAVNEEANRSEKHITHWIGGKPWDGEAERHGDVYDPATGQVTGQVDFASPAEVDLAVARRPGTR